MADIVIDRSDAQIKTGIEKIADVSSSASEIDNVVDNHITQAELNAVVLGSEPQKMIRSSYYGSNTNIKAIVSGDSTSARSEIVRYYGEMFGKANVDFYSNSASGQTGKDWWENTDQNTLQEAIDNSSGTDGEDTLLLYCFGINDWNFGTQAEVKTWLKSGIEAYILAKPSATVILMNPVHTDYPPRNLGLTQIYTELASELSLPLIDLSAATSLISSNSDYYVDGVHPNDFGSRRVVNYVLNYLCPPELSNYIYIDETATVSPFTTAELIESNTIESGYYSTATGVAVANANFRRLSLHIQVEPNYILKTVSLGNMTDTVIFFDANDDFLESVYNDSQGSYRTVTVPSAAKFARMNIATNGSEYDLLGDVPSLTYLDPQGEFMSVENINKGNIINLRINRKDKKLDSLGRTGSVGQVLAINSNGDDEWTTL